MEYIKSILNNYEDVIEKITSIYEIVVVNIDDGNRIYTRINGQEIKVSQITIEFLGMRIKLLKHITDIFTNTLVNIDDINNFINLRQYIKDDNNIKDILIYKKQMGIQDIIFNHIAETVNEANNFITFWNALENDNQIDFITNIKQI